MMFACTKIDPSIRISFQNEYSLIFPISRKSVETHTSTGNYIFQQLSKHRIHQSFCVFVFVFISKNTFTTDKNIMEQEPPLMFYCRQCKTMLNERCFYNSRTGNLDSICTMCSLLNKSNHYQVKLTIQKRNSRC